MGFASRPTTNTMRMPNPSERIHVHRNSRCRALLPLSIPSNTRGATESCARSSSETHPVLQPSRTDGFAGAAHPLAPAVASDGFAAGAGGGGGAMPYHRFGGRIGNGDDGWLRAHLASSTCHRTGLLLPANTCSERPVVAAAHAEPGSGSAERRATARHAARVSVASRSRFIMLVGVAGDDCRVSVAPALHARPPPPRDHLNRAQQCHSGPKSHEDQHQTSDHPRRHALCRDRRPLQLLNAPIGVVTAHTAQRGRSSRGDPEDTLAAHVARRADWRQPDRFTAAQIT